MNLLAVFTLAIVCLTQATRNVPEKIYDRLEMHQEEGFPAEMTQREEAAVKETDEQESENLMERNQNKGQTNEILEEEMLQVACCEPGKTYINLANNASAQEINTASGVTIMVSPTSQRTSNDCSKMALLKVNFERYTDNCVRKPMCGRRMLKIVLNLRRGSRSGFGFNIGDSRTNDAYAGDASTQQNDAEIEGIFPNMRVWTSDKCYSKSLESFSNAISTAVNHVTIYVSNNYVRIVNDKGLDAYLCNKCLFALNGQSDNQGSVNEDIYIGLNRVVSGTYRNGYGICSATLSWTCPY